MEIGDAEADRAMFVFFGGYVEACSMGKSILGTLLLLFWSQINDPLSLKWPLGTILGLGGSSLFCFLFPLLEHAALGT